MSTINFITLTVLLIAFMVYCYKLVKLNINDNDNTTDTHPRK